MSMPTNAMPEVAPQTMPARRLEISVARRFAWTLRRELWEWRAIYIGPALVAAVYFVTYAISTVHLPRDMRNLIALQAKGGLAIDMVHGKILHPYDLAAGLIMATAMLTALYYAVETLYGERRDRSILLWKSMPVSDTMTVLTKATVAIILIPLLSWVLTFVTHLLMLLLSSAVLSASGIGAGMLWEHLRFFHMESGLFLHLMLGHTLWYAPFFAWFLLVSAWAPRAPLLWATLPPLVAGFLEKFIFNTTYFWQMVGNQLSTGPDTGPQKPLMEAMGFSFSHFFGSPAVWIGLAVAAGFLYATIRVRRERGPA